MQWINFLHLYQPVHTDAHIIKEAAEKSYKRIVKILLENPEIHFTLNIQGALLIRLEELGYSKMIADLKKLIERGQVELVGSAAYHPIIPLITEKEAILQIKENETLLRKDFGKNLKLEGFFFPEMAFDNEALKLVKELGYRWVILDEIAYNGKLKQLSGKQVFEDKNGLKIILRSRSLSKSYVPITIAELIKKSESDIAITATDAELYGLRHEDKKNTFEKIVKNPKLKTRTISEFLENRKTEVINPISCNWESLEEDLKKGEAFSLWFSKDNLIQKRLWELANYAYKTVTRHDKDDNYFWARWHLVRGFSSCTFWWASGKDFGLFGPVSWSPDEIERGTNELIRSIRALEDTTTRGTKIKAEKLYIKIKKMIWEKHWNYYWKK